MLSETVLAQGIARAWQPLFIFDMLGKASSQQSGNPVRCKFVGIWGERHADYLSRALECISNGVGVLVLLPIETVWSAMTSRKMFVS